MHNIYPITDTLLQKKDKEKLLKQNAKVIWMVGLSGSGKSTLARALENSLYEAGYLTKLLDGDNLRTGLNKNLGFSEEDRLENIRRTAEAARLFVEGGVVTICSFISPTEAIRKMAKEIIGAENYYEVFISCPVEVCEQRDVKGLYAKARRGEIKDFTGISAPFEAPSSPDLIIQTDREDLNESHKNLMANILKLVKYQ